MWLVCHQQGLRDITKLQVPRSVAHTVYLCNAFFGHLWARLFRSQLCHLFQAATASVDLVLDMNIDPQTAAKIKELNSKKALAVEREDYDEAKSLKNAIERLKAVGAKVAQLEAR
jgi:hypothetical protein